MTMTTDTVATETPDAPDTRLVEQLRSLGVEVEALRQTDHWQAWLKMCGKFHRYSFSRTS